MAFEKRCLSHPKSAGVDDLWRSEMLQVLLEEFRSKILNLIFTTKPVRQGTGLGLLIYQEIVKSHRGRINIDRFPGNGMILPLLFFEVNVYLAPEVENGKMKSGRFEDYEARLLSKKGWI